MPSRNAVKHFVPDYYYHLYTRGVNKRTIFKDDQDYSIFLRYLKLYLLPIEVLKKLSLQDIRINKFMRMNLSQDIDLICYALMTNHIHLLVKLNKEDGIEKLMRRVLTAYAMYFNQKYKRVGHLFQSRYKAAPVLSDEYLIYVTRYIHRNPIKAHYTSQNHYTSLPYFIGQKKASWIKPDEVLEHFSQIQPSLTYESFVKDKNDFEIGDLTLEESA